MTKRPLILLSSLILTTLSSWSVGQVALENSWVRAMPPSQKMTAGYGVVTNDTADTITITGARSSIAHMTELHTTVHSEGVARMERLGEVVLEPGERFEFKPNGPHVMFMGVATMPTLGSQASFCILYNDDQSVCVDAPVLRSAP